MSEKDHQQAAAINSILITLSVLDIEYLENSLKDLQEKLSRFETLGVMARPFDALNEVEYKRLAVKKLKVIIDLAKVHRAWQEEVEKSVAMNNGLNELLNNMF